MIDDNYKGECIYSHESDTENDTDCDLITQWHLQVPQPGKWQDDDGEVDGETAAHGGELARRLGPTVAAGNRFPFL